MNKSLYFLTLVFGLVSIFSCKRPKAVSVPAQLPLPLSCDIQEIDFTLLTSKAKLRYKDNQSEQKTNCNIRMKKDSVVWISVNAAAGFEAFRLLILTDSIHILDRLTNKYSVKDYASLSQDLGVELSFQMIQALILGNLMIPKSPADEVIQSDTTSCKFVQRKGGITITNQVKPAISKIEKVELTDGANSLTVNYLKFVTLGNYSFPSENEINLTYKENNSDQKVEISIEHNKTEFPDKEVNFPFSVPNKFERK